MNYLEKLQKKKIEQNQKLLLALLHTHIGSFYPLRKWLGIDYKGKIDEISDLSIAYNTIYSEKDETITQTRTYQQPDLGYKLNTLLDKLPQLALAIPAVLEPAYSFLWLVAFGLTTTTYQPTTADSYGLENAATTNYGTDVTMTLRDGSSGYNGRCFLYWDTSDIPDGATFSQGDVILYVSGRSGTCTGILNRLTRTDWVESEVTWNIYKTGSNWTTAGGDFTTTNAVTGSLIDNISVWFTWNAATLIKDCYDNQSKKVHLILKTAETGSGGRCYIRTKNETDTSLRPKLTVTYTVAAGPSNLKSYNTNLKANIKSINGNVIANVKSLNGNT